MNTEKLIPAPIDEKNVTTDWIEEIFDDYNCVRNGNLFTGFVHGSVCNCLVGKRHIIWQINKNYAKSAKESYQALFERLRTYDAPPLIVKYDVSMKEELFLGQSFFWVDE